MLHEKKLFSKFLIAICSVIFCFLSIEMVLRAMPKEKVENIYELVTYTHDGRRLSMKDGGMKIVMSPFTIYKNMPNQSSAVFNINSIGLRGREVASNHNKPKRAIVLGGSAAFGFGLKGDDKTFSSLLEKGNKKYEVLNAGVIGFTSGQELVYLVTELIDYNPNIVIAFNGWNDLFFARINYVCGSRWSGKNKSFNWIFGVPIIMSYFVIKNRYP